MSTKTFDLGDILSITTGALVSRRHMEGIYDILSHMTGESLYTHQLPRGMNECLPYLLEQHPDLNGIEVPDWIDDDESCNRWLDSLIPEYGETREVERIPPGAHEIIDPIQELIDKMGPERVIVVATDPDTHSETQETQP